jgi:hypothetical protein
MRADLIKQLERLEQYIPPRTTPEDAAVWQAQRLLMLVLAHDRGGLQEHEAIAVGFARALGYHDHEGYNAFRADLRHNPARVSERHGKAINAFFVAHGLDPEAADVDEKLELVDRVFREMPPALQSRIDTKADYLT